MGHESEPILIKSGDPEVAFKMVWLVEGITDLQIDKLIGFSNTDEEVRKFTSDDSLFKDREAFEKWKKQGISAYTIADSQENLLGIVWFGQETIPQREFIQRFDPTEYQITFAIRTYGEARGKRLARSFTEEAFRLFRSSEIYHTTKGKGVWLETSSDNTPALRLFERFGFIRVTDPSSDNKVLMILPGIHALIGARLPNPLPSDSTSEKAVPPPPENEATFVYGPQVSYDELRRILGGDKREKAG